jgi:hypothetical protein
VLTDLGRPGKSGGRQGFSNPLPISRRVLTTEQPLIAFNKEGFVKLEACGFRRETSLYEARCIPVEKDTGLRS